MSKIQTRRSISVSRQTYERLKAYCEATNTSMSSFVENRIDEALKAQPAKPEAQPHA